MSVVTFEETWETDAETDIGGNEYTRRFKVLISDDALSIAFFEALNAPGLPPRGEPFQKPGASDLTVRAGRRRIVRTENRLFFIVEVEYRPIDRSDQEEIVDPLDREPDISWGFSERTKVFAKDINDKPIVNSAESSFDPPPEVPIAIPTVTIVRNEATFSPGAAHEFINAVNEFPVLIAGFNAPARVAKLLDFSGVRRFENDILYFEVTYLLEFQEGTHDVEVLDQGIYDLAGQRISRTDGTFADKPVPLVDGFPIPPNTDDVPVFITFELFKKQNFVTLNLPKQLS